MSKVKRFFSRARFNVHDVINFFRDPAGSAKAVAAGVIAFGAQNGVDLPDSVDSAFVDLLVALAVAFAAWVTPNYARPDRALDER